MSPRAYTLLKDSEIEPKAKAGTIIYECMKHDYGCANDDTRHTGIEHRSFTLDPAGDYPFFTVPLRDLVSSPDTEAKGAE